MAGLLTRLAAKVAETCGKSTLSPRVLSAADAHLRSCSYPGSPRCIPIAILPGFKQDKRNVLHTNLKKENQSNFVLRICSPTINWRNTEKLQE